jgi:hypothetical protein
MRIKILEKGSKGLRKGKFYQKEALLYQGWKVFLIGDVGSGLKPPSTKDSTTVE